MESAERTVKTREMNDSPDSKNQRNEYSQDSKNQRNEIQPGTNERFRAA